LRTIHHVTQYGTHRREFGDSRALRGGVWIVVATALAAALAGCSTAKYSAAKLPAGLAAPAVRPPQTIDVSRLATSTASSESIQPGDVLDVTLTTGAEDRPPLPWPLRVAEDGTVEVPLIGRVVVGGMELTAAEQVIRQASVDRGLFRHPQVAVLMKKRRSRQVTVVGAVKRPGSYDLPATQSNLVGAIVAAGGLADGAGTLVDIRQPAPRPSLDATAHRPVSHAAGYPPTPGVLAGGDHGPGDGLFSVDLASHAQTAGEQWLDDGAVVMVRPEEPRKISVIGLVKRPGQFTVPPDQPVRLLDALALAGGRTLEVADSVTVIRTIPGSSEPAVIGVSVRRAKQDAAENLLLGPGDVVSVEETPVTAVVEAVRTYLRFSFSSRIPGL
jgi:polysaccharide export outer membrane protein